MCCFKLVNRRQRDANKRTKFSGFFLFLVAESDCGEDLGDLEERCCDESLDDAARKRRQFKTAVFVCQEGSVSTEVNFPFESQEIHQIL